jgi:hypothetical protein
MPSIIPLRPQVLQQSESGESSSQVDNDEAVGHFEFIAEVDATDSDQLRRDFSTLYQLLVHFTTFNVLKFESCS